MLWRRRTDHDYDWQRELLVRTPSSLTPSAELDPTREDRPRVTEHLGTVVGAALTVLAVAGLAIQIFDPKPTGLPDAVSVASGSFLSILMVVSVASRVRRWIKRPADDGAWRVLHEVWKDSNKFLKRPPDRSVYDRWLSSAGDRLALISPSLASQWAEPGCGLETSEETVSWDQLQSRRKRILALYQLVAQGAYEPLEAGPHALRSGGLDRSIAE
jgi:hypothetical protein